MSKQEKSAAHIIDKKWVREEKRFFSEYPGLPRTGIPGEEETWLELSQFYRDDLKWLLSLEHHKFWSYMIHSEKAHELLLSFLKKAPPSYMKHNFLVREDMRKVFTEIEHLVFLVFLRLSTEKESESCFIRNFPKIIYNNYLFTVPVILDICLIYGASNHDLVKKMINNIISSAPDFLDDFQEIIPHFLQALKTVKEKFLGKGVTLLKDKIELGVNEVEDLVLYLSDSVATIQVFFAIYPNVCQLFSREEVIAELVKFYSDILPEVVDYWSKNCQPVTESSLVSDLIGNIRIDLLRIVKHMLDFVVCEGNEIPEKKEETMKEYLTLMNCVVSEPAFLYDYNMIYSVEFEMGCALENFNNIDMTKVNCILEAVASIMCDNDQDLKNTTAEEVAGATLNSLVTEVKDILPHLEESFIRECLSYYDNNTERVIAAVLENSIPPSLKKDEKKEKTEELHELKRNPIPSNLKKDEKKQKTEEMLELKGKHKNKHSNLNEMLNDREEIIKMKERYAELSYVADDTYDDEYDDTYDDNVEIPLRDGDEIGGRPFVVPRVLRTRDENEEEEEEEEEEQQEEEGSRRDQFIENPAIVRERMMQARADRGRRDVVGRGRGQGQSRQVVKNREFKEAHKSFMANHNRKKQASRKMGRGMIPF